MFVIISRDSADAASLRKAHLQDHLCYAESVMDKIASGGPLRGKDGVDHGSLVVLDVASEEDARSILEADPYYRAGVWQTSEILPFRPVVGTWLGGKTW